ncbi:hypothetical protein UlMin_023792 [Ulmus minor]
MSLVSKRWRCLCNSVPVIDLCELYSGQNFRRKFPEILNDCMIHRRRDKIEGKGTGLSRLKLGMFSSSTSSARLNGWLIIWAQSKLEELDLCIETGIPKNYYMLPPSVLSMTSLTIMKLYGVSLEGLVSVNLPSLTCLSLKNVRMDDQMLHKLLMGCCSLEKLLLKDCVDLFNPIISNSSLKSFEFVNGLCQTILQVEAKNLQSFTYDGGPSTYGEFNLPFCGTIRNLSLSNMLMNDGWLEDIIVRIPLLESLSLCNFTQLEHVEICSQHLKHLVFRGDRCCSGVENIVDTPNLVSFIFEGHLLSEFSMIKRRPNVLNADIKLFSPHAYDTRWYFNLLDFLANFDCSNTLNLKVYTEEALIFPDKFRKRCYTPLPTLKHMKVILINCLILNKSNLRDTLLWISPSLETLLIEQKLDIVTID